jgi:lysophospholipase L1-like esterase
VQINRAGFRDREHELKKPANTFRIAVLGDSFAEAVQVSREDTFWSVLERRLAAAAQFAEMDVEVLNFGISGHGTAQQLQMLQHYALSYEPDVVLLAFFAGNDVRNNSPQLEPYDVRPFFSLDDAQLKLDDSFLRHPDFFKANSAVTRIKVTAINASRMLQVLNEWKNRPPQPAQSDSDFETGIDDQVFVEPVEPIWQAAWEVTDALILEINRIVRQHDARLVVATVTQAIQLHPAADVRTRFANQLGVRDLFYPESRIEALGKEGVFDVVALSRPMLDAATRDQEFFHGFEATGLGKGHWNAAGHRLAGELIAEALLESPGQSSLD